MRYSVVLCLVLTTLVGPIGCGRKNEAATDSWVSLRPIPVEATPVRNWLQAIKARDIELFKTVFTQRIATSFAQKGWGTMLGVYTTIWTEQLGDYDINEMSFSFTADEANPQRGTVTVSLGERSFPPLQVRFEDGCWRVDER